MKKISLLLSLGLITSMTTHAGLGGLGLSSLASKTTESVTGVSSTNIDLQGFFQQAQVTNALFIESRVAIASLLTSKENSTELKNKLKTLKTTSDLKEKEALQTELAKLSSAVLEASQKDEAATVAKLEALGKEQKNLLLGAATNFALAGLTATELAKNSKQVSTNIASNPMSLRDTGLSLTNAKSLVNDVTGIAKNSSLALVEFPKVFKKAGIDFKVPASTAAKPVDISASL